MSAPNFRPASSARPRAYAAIALVLLAVSALFVALAPFAMPDAYSWRSNAISESAAQGLPGAWITRLGFVCFGLAVLGLTVSNACLWNRGAIWMHTAFGVFMTCTAAFSHRPWLADVPYDPVEDFLHSLTATGMGFAFAFGVLLRLLQRIRWRERGFDAVALAAATLLPMTMAALPAWAGLLQRLMFLTAYAWYGREALSMLCLLRPKQGDSE